MEGRRDVLLFPIFLLEEFEDDPCFPAIIGFSLHRQVHISYDCIDSDIGRYMCVCVCGIQQEWNVLEGETICIMAKMQ